MSELLVRRGAPEWQSNVAGVVELPVRDIAQYGHGRAQRFGDRAARNGAVEFTSAATSAAIRFIATKAL